MDIEKIRNYSLQKHAVRESFPFDQETLVHKVGGKMFLLMNLNSEVLQINVKTNPDKSIELREKYHQIIPGYHMNKKHWNTIIIDGFISDRLIYNLIDESYNLVVKSLSKAKKAEFGL